MGVVVVFKFVKVKAYLTWKWPRLWLRGQHEGVTVHLLCNASLVTRHGTSSHFNTHSHSVSSSGACQLTCFLVEKTLSVTWNAGTAIRFTVLIIVWKNRLEWVGFLVGFVWHEIRVQLFRQWPPVSSLCDCMHSSLSTHHSFRVLVTVAKPCYKSSAAIIFVHR